MSNPTGTFGGLAYGLFGGANPNQQAPNIDTTGANAWEGDPNQAKKNQQAQQTAQDLALQTAEGKGPSAATELLKQQTAETQAATNALAASGSGSSGQGIARRNAMMAGSNAMQTLGGQAATARAQEQLGGESLYGNLTSAARGQDLTAAGQQAQLASNQAQIQEQQNQTNAQVAQQQAQQGSQLFGQIAGMAAGAALLADGDMGGHRVGTSDFKEPGGPDHWILREEGNFILAVNARTGKMFKVGMEHLTPAEKREALAPHGAGPINGPDSQRVHKQMADGDYSQIQPIQPQSAPQMPQQGGGMLSGVLQGVMGAAGGGGSGGGAAAMADGDLGGDSRFAELVRRAHPGLYKAAKSYADSDLGTEIARAAYGGRGTGDASDYPVPNFVSQPSFHRGPDPEDQPGSDADWAAADRLAARAAGEAPPARATGGYDEGWDDVIRANGGSAPGDPDAPAAASSHGGFLSALGGALLGYSSLNAVARLAAARQRPQGYGPNDVPTVDRAYTDPQGNQYNYGDADLSAALQQAMDEADKRIAKAQQNEWARQTTDKALRDIGRLRTEVLSSMEPPADDTRTILKRRPGSSEGSIVEDTAPSGRQLEALGWGNFQNVALPGSASGLRMGEVTERRFHDADLEEDPESEETGTETNTAREAFDKDVARTRRDLDEDKPVRRIYDVDDPLDVWDYEAGLQRKRDDARVLADMDRSNPYIPSADVPGGPGSPIDIDDAEQVAEYERAHPARPALAALFSVPKAAPKVGPTDFIDTMTARNRQYDRRGGLAQAARDFERDEALDAAHEKALARLGLDLVPGEAEGISMDEARKRTKNRQAVRALMKLWENESRTPRPPRPEDETEEMVASYPDADLSSKRTRKKGSALTSLMAKKKRKAA